MAIFLVFFPTTNDDDDDDDGAQLGQELGGNGKRDLFVVCIQSLFFFSNCTLVWMRYAKGRGRRRTSTAGLLQTLVL